MIHHRLIAPNFHVGPYPHSGIEVAPTLFVDLTLPDERPGYAELLSSTGAQHRRFPIPPAEEDFDTRMIRRAIDTIEAELNDGGSVYLHSSDERRTGFLMSCWLVVRDESELALKSAPAELVGQVQKWCQIWNLEETVRSLLPAQETEDTDDAIDDLLASTIDEFIDIKNQLLISPDHQRHQAVARGLQRIGHPDSIPYIETVFEQGFDFLAYTCSDHDVIAKWFSWLLFDIGTPEARALLVKLSNSQNPDIAREMTYRLSKWPT
ncbi:hypothetical protein FRD01_08225 [Microvenator marinus]|uniref:Uncharacterized protein n=1 Tax=Microvenator marinus TaxID=2600177 RepID=A0A5B8XQI2_9DELT|nr:hypothetical protein [Microvenator marinus]QED27228.1 hypothetical protein FRD01_08225 [Microvenator marinus]